MNSVMIFTLKTFSQCFHIIQKWASSVCVIQTPVRFCKYITPIVLYDMFHIPISRSMDQSPSWEDRGSENLLPFMKLRSSQELTSWTQFTLSHPIFSTRILILLLHLCIGHQIGLFPWGFQTTILYAFLIISMCSSCPIYFILLGFISLIIQ
jgi:hypothetical protein